MNNYEDTLGKYQILEQIGRGGFATVYRAKNIKLGNEVVLKVMDSILAEDESFVRRFEQEAQEMVQLDHSNIVRIVDLDKIKNKLFIVMEYVPGHNLRESLPREGLLPLETVVSIISQVGKALDYAHSRKLIHRDVKPANILLRHDGVAKLTDFGIAKALENTQLTRTGMMMGTPTYMSPEQTKGLSLDGRSDLYSLGVVLFELVTGKVPFEGDTATLLYKQVHEDPPSPSQIAIRAKGPLEPILVKALAKNPNDRYQTGKELTAELEKALQEIQKIILTNMYGQTMILMKERKYTEALAGLESLNAIKSGYENVTLLIEHARKGIELVEMYQKARQHVDEARKLAAEIVQHDPSFPDPDNVLQAVNRISAIDWQRVALWIGSAIVLTVYSAASWVWVKEVHTVTAVDGTVTVTTIQNTAEGLAMLLTPGSIWGMWIPFLCIWAILGMTFIQRKQTERSSQLLIGIKWAILLVGLVSTIVVNQLGSIFNKNSVVIIIASLSFMLATEVIPTLQARQRHQKLATSKPV